MLSSDFQYSAQIHFLRCLSVDLLLFPCLCLQMNDMLLYTYPQQDGKYRLKNTLSLTGLKVKKKLYFLHLSLFVTITHH